MTDDGGQAILLRIVEQIRDDLADERQLSHEHRARLHTRLDEVHERLSRLDTSVALSGQVDAQVRDELDELKATVANIQPTVDEWRRMRALGLGIVGIIATGGISFGAALIWFGNTMAEWVRAWLHLPPTH